MDKTELKQNAKLDISAERSTQGPRCEPGGIGNPGSEIRLFVWTLLIASGHGGLTQRAAVQPLQLLNSW